MSNVDILNRLYEMLVRPVILPIPLGEKGPTFKGWNKVKWEDTQEEPYKQRIIDAIERGGNLGILLGENSGNLVTIDFDIDEEMDEFFRIVPWARNSMITRGKKAGQVWFYMEEYYPHKRLVLMESEPGKPCVEFRGGGGIQSVCFGLHPEGMSYVWNGLSPLQINYVDLSEWLGSIQGKNIDEDGPTRVGQAGDWTWLKKYPKANFKELDLIGLLEEKGVRARQIDKERYAVTCPWMKGHTTENKVRDAAVFQFQPRGTYFPAFRCMHGHCINRNLKDLLEWLKVTPDEVRRWCRTQVNKIVSIEECQEEFSWIEKEPELPRQIVDQILYEKTKLLLAGPPKIRKSWFAMDMALSICLGEPFLGFDTCQSRILFLNMEIPAEFFRWRMYKMQKARGIKSIPDGGFTALHLRGSNAFDGDWKELAQYCVRHGPFAALFIDTIYKVLGPRDENKASDMADLLRNVDMVSNASGAAIIEVHHYAKGDYTQKDVGDRASGSGVFYRDPDSFLAMSHANKEKLYDEGRVDVRSRLQKPLDPIGIRWNNYRWDKDDSIDFKKQNEDRPKEFKPKQSDKLAEILKMKPGLTNKDLFIRAKRQGITQASSSYNKALKEAVIDGKIIQRGDKYYPAVM